MVETSGAVTKVHPRNLLLLASLALPSCTNTPQRIADLPEPIQREISSLVEDRVQSALADLPFKIVTRAAAEKYATELATLRAQVNEDVRRLVESCYAREQSSLAQSAVETLLRMRTLEEAEPDALKALTSSARQRRLLPYLEMGSCTVQLQGDDTVGTGTIIYSGPYTDMEQATCILTSYHVVRNIFADTPSAVTQGVLTSVYSMTSPGRHQDFRAHLVEKLESADLALLVIKEECHRPPVFPRFLSPDELKLLSVGDPIFAFGCPLGSEPVPSQGVISHKRNPINNVNYWLITAPTYFGNSGGGIWYYPPGDAGNGTFEPGYYLTAFSKIYTQGRRSGVDVLVTHMGLGTDPLLTSEFLSDAGFIIDAASHQLTVPQPWCCRPN